MKLKVDTLKHIHDHGLAVQFADPRLVSLIEELKRKEGKTVLTAGESELTLWKLGPVLFSEAYWAHGSYSHATAHYLDETPQGLLKFALRREACEGSASAYATLRAVILGDVVLPQVWHPRFGVDQDTLRDWARKWAWTLLGAQGLRAQALEKLVQTADAKVAAHAQALRDAERSQRSRESESPEYWAQCLENLRERALKEAEARKADIAHAEAKRQAILSFDWAGAAAMGWTASPAPVSAGHLMAFNLTGLRADMQGNWGARTFCAEGPYFEGLRETVSPAHVSPNYTASLEGDILVLSSGISAEFTGPQLLAWLKGEAPAPRSRYGTLGKLETVRRDPTAPHGWAPVTLVTCGCHRVDLARDLGGAYAEALRPSHSVTYTAERPALYLKQDPGEFAARAAAIAERWVAEAKEAHATALRNYLRRKQEIKADMAAAPLALAKARQAVTEAKEALEKAEAERKALPLPLGASLGAVTLSVNAALLALVGKGGAL